MNAERKLRANEHTQALAQRLYQVMPGAVQPPSDERGKLWGEVEDTPEYDFCEQIALEIMRAAQAYSINP
ncbi:hypothetical protein [Hyphomicrobium sp. ghe19]|uniref:hypothetical protein n=1 Tax=Hyphomicrobium sp. ghe19 TaxID=2682968 RepID=UPI00136734B5|nr:hypothetical protein HYPP_01963 [Hyphomicrobium sp. ghe19]